MPINEFQKKVLRLIAQNRNPESYIAGASVINRKENSPRYSSDIDVFHDPEKSVLESYQFDKKLLESNHYKVSTTYESNGFIRSVVSKEKDSVKLEWATDSAFRFFPIVADKDFGYRLNDIDSAINKCLALASRTEVRDVIDLLTINDEIIHVGYCCWAACGKDPGLTPQLILDLLSRNARITPDLLALENLVKPIDLKLIKKKWLLILEEAAKIVTSLDSKNIGCIFLNEKNEIETEHSKAKKIHFGSVKGAWPSLD